MIYTISEIANMAIVPREPMMDTVVLPANTVNALIADWRAMYSALHDHWMRTDCLKPFDKCALAVAYSNLKVKP